ncbi:MAG: hypothetical protein FWG03_08900 [Clostridiales bacterium]|nr:hypothetical protein [Clostridiales bacterium]
MKKVLIIALALALVLTLAAGCSGSGNDADEGAKRGIDALPVDSGDGGDVLTDLDIGNLKSMILLDDEGFVGKTTDEPIFAPVNEGWVSTADSVE